MGSRSNNKGFSPKSPHFDRNTVWECNRCGGSEWTRRKHKRYCIKDGGRMA